MRKRLSVALIVLFLTGVAVAPPASAAAPAPGFDVMGEGTDFWGGGMECSIPGPNATTVTVSLEVTTDSSGPSAKAVVRAPMAEPYLPYDTIMATLFTTDVKVVRRDHTVPDDIADWYGPGAEEEFGTSYSISRPTTQPTYRCRYGYSRPETMPYGTVDLVFLQPLVYPTPTELREKCRSGLVDYFVQYWDHTQQKAASEAQFYLDGGTCDPKYSRK